MQNGSYWTGEQGMDGWTDNQKRYASSSIIGKGIINKNKKDEHHHRRDAKFLNTKMALKMWLTN